MVTIQGGATERQRSRTQAPCRVKEGCIKGSWGKNGKCDEPLRVLFKISTGTWMRMFQMQERTRALVQKSVGPNLVTLERLVCLQRGKQRKI